MEKVLVLLALFSVFLIVFNLCRLLAQASRKEEELSNATVISGNRVIQGSAIDKNDVKYLYGAPVSTTDELKEWGVIKGFADAICAHLSELMREAEDGKCKDYAALSEQWNIYYGRLRALCIRHKLWNGMLNDRQIFLPTEKQLSLENDLRRRFSEACESGIDKAYESDYMRDQINNYLILQPKHESVRRIMVNDLAGSSSKIRKQYRKICTEMVRDGVLSEKHNKAGDLVVKRKKTVEKKKAPVVLAPSIFSRELYANIDYQMMCKVKHTVGTPENVDRAGNRCEFTSLSHGERYYTSLQCCTCVAFENGSNPCKHMVALAKYLSYI